MGKIQWPGPACFSPWRFLEYLSDLARLFIYSMYIYIQIICSKKLRQWPIPNIDNGWQSYSFFLCSVGCIYIYIFVKPLVVNVLVIMLDWDVSERRFNTSRFLHQHISRNESRHAKRACAAWTSLLRVWIAILWFQMLSNILDIFWCCKLVPLECVVYKCCIYTSEPVWLS